MQVLTYIFDRIAALLHEEEAQDGFEYMLVVGGVSVAVIIAILAIGPNSLANAVCDAINNISVFSTFDC
ncbi:MAG TPA: hypothetical protein VNN10_10100 [Dehalococcoidia bacterium]|nr:hypothetical protein [Dehalococcoidia bacterium]